MRIAHLVQRYPPAFGGSEVYFARLSRYLVERGDEVFVFTTTGKELSSFWDRRAGQFPAGIEQDQGVSVQRFALWHLPLGHRYVLKGLSLLPIARWQAMTAPVNPIAPGMWNLEGSFDLVHATAFPYSFPLLCGRRLAQRLGIPFLLTPFVHTGDPCDPQDRTRRAYTTPALMELARSANRVFVQTIGEREVLLERGVQPARIVLQGLGVDLPSCTGGDRAKARKSWRLEPGEVVVGHLANNSVEKGSVDLLRAAEQVWSEGVNFTVLLAGPEMPNFREFWSRYVPRGRVLRLGTLTEQQKRDFFASIDLFALPSRSDSFGLVLPEAWANSVPCVGYRAGGIPWVIRDRVDGRLVACGQVDQLARVLRELIESPEQRRQLGEAGRARLGEFDWNAKLGLVREVYTTVCAESIRLRQG